MDKKILGEQDIMENRPETAKEPVQGKDQVEYNSLEVHVALSRERHEEIGNRFDRVEANISKVENKMDTGFQKIEKIIMWTAGTMFFTMLTILFTVVFGGLIK